jgi:hypothetical protein
VRLQLWQLDDSGLGIEHVFRLHGVHVVRVEEIETILENTLPGWRQSDFDSRVDRLCTDAQLAVLVGGITWYTVRERLQSRTSGIREMWPRDLLVGTCTFLAFPASVVWLYRFRLIGPLEFRPMTTSRR